jgi:hypothetical protein
MRTPVVAHRGELAIASKDRRGNDYLLYAQGAPLSISEQRPVAPVSRFVCSIRLNAPTSRSRDGGAA